MGVVCLCSGSAWPGLRMTRPVQAWVMSVQFLHLNWCFSSFTFSPSAAQEIQSFPANITIFNSWLTCVLYRFQ